MAKFNIIISFGLILLAYSPSFGDLRIHQFSTGEYAVITNKYVSIRKSPSIDSKRIDYVHIGLLVKVIDMSNEPISIKNRDGRWIKIKAQKRYWQEKEPVSGWLFDAFVKPLNEFVPTGRWDGFEKFISCIGDSCQELRLKDDGSFEDVNTSIDFDVSDDEVVEEKKGSGKTYQWGKILWFKLDDKKTNQHGYVVVEDDHGQYCLSENIDPNSGVCHENADDGIYPR